MQLFAHIVVVVAILNTSLASELYCIHALCACSSRTSRFDISWDLGVWNADDSPMSVLARGVG